MNLQRPRRHGAEGEVELPISLTAQTISTRAGDSAMMAAVAPRPSSRGMFTSMVITSGRSWRAFSTASTPSRASPTMLRSCSCASRAISALRMVSESSATRIRIGWRRVMQPPAGGRSPAWTSASRRPAAQSFLLKKPVGAGGRAALPVGVGIARGDEDDGHRLQLVPAARLERQLEPVHLVHADVETITS